MKKWMTGLLLTGMAALPIAGCGNSSDNGNNASASPSASASASSGAAAGTDSKKNVKIHMFQFKVEIADALNKMAEQYKAETGATVEVETHGGGEDYNALLKAELASGSEPEIITLDGYTALKPYLDRATDLSGEAWVKDLIESAKEPTTVDGKLYGLPMNVEGYGLIYNKDLFAKAGITDEPKTLPQLKDAAAKLKAAGITPFEATNEWWSLGMHLLNAGLANEPDPKAYVEGLIDGSKTFKGDPVMTQWLDLVDTIFGNAKKEKTTTDYATQVANFAAGKAAMMLQGNWTQGDIDKVDPNLNLGILPLPINEQEGKIMVGVPSNWVVNSKSKQPEEAKAFLNWLVTSDSGKAFITKDFKFIPSLTTIDAQAADIGQVAVEIQGKSSTALGWYWSLFPDGVTQGFGAAMQEYLGASISRDQLLEKLDKSVQDIVKQ